MGVNPTPSNFKTFTFDNTNSAQYGVYITGQGVFNAPERNVEMVEIPGRDGAYALDKGNFNNIEVTYPAGIVADTEADFATAVSNLRNFLCSKTGYCRLSDDYNSGEYRMAVYKSGLDVSHEGLRTGEFDIVFECKPQRWLTSGETKTTLTSGNAITNPTLFPSRPQLQTYGYGDISIGGEVITVQNIPVGEVAVPIDTNGTVDLSALNSGDNFTLSGANVTIRYNADSNVSVHSPSIVSTTNCSATKSYSSMNAKFEITLDDYTFAKGTSGSRTSTIRYTIPVYNGSNIDATATMVLAYNGNNDIDITTTISPATEAHFTIKKIISFTQASVFGESSVSANGTPTYIDLDIGEAYNIVGTEAVSVNNAVTIPAELPTLKSGATTITFSNTFTKVDIVPRWWKV